MDSSWLDSFLPYYRHKLFWAPLYVFLLSFIIINFPKNNYQIIGFILLTLAISDSLSSHLIKKTVKRPRPCNEIRIMNQVVNRVRCGGGYSFTSSHATNHSALAFFIFFLFKRYASRWRLSFVIWAVSIGVAQIYVGVHYPVDVIVGLSLGALIGFLVSKGYEYFFEIP